jgi:hypothetical protein
MAIVVSIRLAVGGRGRRCPRLAYEAATLNANRNRVSAPTAGG